MQKQKITKEEKAVIKAIINLRIAKGIELEITDAKWLESELTTIIDNKNCEYRFLVEDFITTLLV